MPDDDFFHDALNDQSADQAARLLLAEWLAERGDPAALAYHWMVRGDKFTTPREGYLIGSTTWDWWSMLPGYHGAIGDHNNRPDRINPSLMQLLEQCAKKSDWSGHCAYCEFFTRREAEDALADALSRAGMLGETH